MKAPGEGGGEVGEVASGREAPSDGCMGGRGEQRRWRAKSREREERERERREGDSKDTTMLIHVRTSTSIYMYMYIEPQTDGQRLTEDRGGRDLDLHTDTQRAHNASDGRVP